MLAPPRSFIDWPAFAFAAIVPAFAFGAVALRAARSEESALLAEEQSSVQSSAQRIPSIVDEILLNTERAIPENIPEAPSALYAFLQSKAPPGFRILLLDSQGKPLLEAPADSLPKLDSPHCADLVLNFFRSNGSTKEEMASNLFHDCPEAKSSSGRFLVPMLRFETIRSQSGAARTSSAQEFAAWLSAHPGLLSDQERSYYRVAISGLEMASALKSSIFALIEQSSRSVSDLSGASSRILSLSPSDSWLRWKAVDGIGLGKVFPDGRRIALVLSPSDFPKLIEAQLPKGQRLLLPNSGAKMDLPIRAEGRLSESLRYTVVLADQSRFREMVLYRRRLILASSSLGLLWALGLAGFIFHRFREARRLAALRTDFVSAVSHELRTPVSSVLMLSELLQQGNIETAELPSVYGALAKESRRLADTVERLLSFGRLSRGRLVAQRKQTRLSDLLTEALNAFQERHPELAKVETDLDPIVAAVDPAQIRLAVDNFLDNAAKYAPLGAPFRLSLKRQKGEIVIGLADHGPGIASVDLKRIFRPFERVEDRLSQEVSGNGIGLALVQFVAKAHQGRAWAISEAGKGSCFYFSVSEKHDNRVLS